MALRSDRWIGADYWEQPADKTLTLDDLLMRCEMVVMGIAGGGLDDLLGLAVPGREKETRRWLLWSRAWANPSVLQPREGEVSMLRDFEEADELVICKEFGEDIAEIAELIQRIDTEGLFQAVALDPYGVGAIVDALDDAGING